jgi:hypothetical protein
MTEQFYIDYSSIHIWLPSAMVARLASIAKRHQKVAGSSPAVVTFLFFYFLQAEIFKISNPPTQNTDIDT